MLKYQHDIFTTYLPKSHTLLNEGKSYAAKIDFQRQCTLKVIIYRLLERFSINVWTTSKLKNLLLIH